MQTQFGWSRSVLSGAFALSRAESGLLGPLQGWLIDKFGPRVMVRGGMVLFGLGFIMFSRLDSVLDYYLAFLLMALGSSVGGFLTVAATVVNWFEKRRGVAMGIAMSGFGIGGLLVPAIAWSLTELGWRQTAFLSGVAIIVLGCRLASCSGSGRSSTATCRTAPRSIRPPPPQVTQARPPSGARRPT